MRHYFLRVLGWTSASTSMRWCLVDDTKRPGSCGGLCLRWCTWKLTHPHQSSNHLICPPIRRMPCCRTPASVFSSLQSGLGPAKPSSLKKGAQLPQLGIGAMPIPMRSWTSWLRGSMHPGLQWRTSSQALGEALRPPRPGPGRSVSELNVAQSRLWQWGDGVWYDPSFFMPEQHTRS